MGLRIPYAGLSAEDADLLRKREKQALNSEVGMARALESSVMQGLFKTERLPPRLPAQRWRHRRSGRRRHALPALLLAAHGAGGDEKP